MGQKSGGILLKLNREQAIKILSAQEIYDAMDLEMFYDEQTGRYPSIYDILHQLGVHENEIDYVKSFSLSKLVIDK